MHGRSRTLASTLLLSCGFAGIQLMAQKPGAATPASWPCVITFHETVLDVTGGAGIPAAIRADGAGPYVHGQSGVSCYIEQDTRSSHYGYLFVNAARESARYFLFPGQLASLVYTRQGYGTFQNRQPGYFEITRIDTATFSANSMGGQQTARRRVRVGVGSHLDFNAASSGVTVNPPMRSPRTRSPRGSRP